MSKSKQESYDAKFEKLPAEHKQQLLNAVRKTVINAICLKFGSRSTKKSSSNQCTFEIPREDAPALAEYRRQRNLTNKGTEGKAKNIRLTFEYWEIVARLREADVVEVLPDVLKSVFADRIKEHQQDLKGALAEEATLRQKIESEVNETQTIDGLLAIAATYELPLSECDEDKIEETIYKIVKEDVKGRYSDSTEVRAAYQEAIEDVEARLSCGDLSEYYYDIDFDQGFSRYRRSYVNRPIESPADIEELVDPSFEDELIDKMVSSFEEWEMPYCPVVVTGEVFNEAFTSNPEIKAFVELLEVFDGDWYCLRDRLDWELADWEGDFRNSISGYFPKGEVLELIRSNPHYSDLFEADEKLEQEFLTRMPENPIDLYPKARSLQRHFILHIGPTNSGKTHDAIGEMARAVSGVYLGPLRLLAFEQYEKLNELGRACSLVTGEEIKEVFGAEHVASTIEMLNFNKEYEVAVIDEAQMMSDPDRGNRWTEAIVGVAAHRVHVCMSLSAKKLAIKLVEACGDTYEIVEHERFTPLKSWTAKNYLNKGVEKGDALIVFSRRAVHALAADLRQKGHKVSIIYGALPYDVRHAQARAFAEGSTDIVVATDAIGMGMNLPIRRVMFMEQAKFDGYQKRFLNSSEVKQIAGRAGRYGIHEAGWYSSDHELGKIKNLFGAADPSLKVAPLGFSSTLLGIEGKVSVLMNKWADMEVADPFTKISCMREIALAKELEEKVGVESKDLETKKLIYKFATLPFKENVDTLKYIWKMMFASELAGHPYTITVPEGDLPSSLDVLEYQYAELDLMFQYCRMFGYSEYYDAIQDRRDAISEKMIELLGRQNVFEGKKCRECGKTLPWNWPYPMCDPCHSKLYPPRYRYDFDFYDDDEDDEDYYW